MNQKLRFQLAIPQQEIMRFYQGNAQNLRVTLDDGRTIQLPLNNFRHFVDNSGLHGQFEVEFTKQHKLVSLIKLS